MPKTVMGVKLVAACTCKCNVALVSRVEPTAPRLLPSSLKCQSALDVADQTKHLRKSLPKSLFQISKILINVCDYCFIYRN